MKFDFLIWFFTFRLSFFELIPKCHLCFNVKIWEEKPFLYSFNMGFENKAYGLNLLIVP